jgi:hypothetical protein
MALDPGIRDLLQAIEEALAQQPAADDRAQLNELASRADLVRQAVKRALQEGLPRVLLTRSVGAVRRRERFVGVSRIRSG